MASYCHHRAVHDAMLAGLQAAGPQDSSGWHGPPVVLSIKTVLPILSSILMIVLN